MRGTKGVLESRHTTFGSACHGISTVVRLPGVQLLQRRQYTATRCSPQVHESERPLALRTTDGALSELLLCSKRFFAHEALEVCTFAGRTLSWLSVLLPLRVGRAGGGRLGDKCQGSSRWKRRRRTEGADKILLGNVSTSRENELVGACMRCASQIFISTGRQEERFLQNLGMKTANEFAR